MLTHIHFEDNEPEMVAVPLDGTASPRVSITWPGIGTIILSELTGARKPVGPLAKVNHHVATTYADA
jgi:hypothetical protein